MKRILVFAAYFYPHKGGHEKYVEEVCSRLANSGWDVDVVTSLLPGMKKREKYRGMTIYRVPTWDSLGKTYPIPCFSLLRMLCTFSLKNYDVVMTHTRFFVLTLFGTCFARKYSIPQIHIEHGTCHPKVKPWLFPFVWLYDYTVGWFVLSKATMVAGISSASQNFVNHLCSRKTVLLPNAVDTSFFTSRAVNKTGKTITFVGRLIAAKGVQDLLEATRDMKNVKVLIVGTGNYETELRSIAGKNVTFLGERNAEEIRDILSKSDIFVNPSYAEGLPTSVLEAGAIGLPVIATDVGGTKEIIRDGVNGYLIQPKTHLILRKKIQFLLESATIRKKFGLALRKRIREEFDWRVTAKKLEKLIERYA